MSPPDTAPAPPSLAAAWFALLAPYRAAVRQDRVFARLAHLAVAAVLGLGRHAVSPLLAALGVGGRDWGARHRLFDRARIDVAAMRATPVLAAASPGPGSPFRRAPRGGCGACAPPSATSASAPCCRA